MFNNVLDGVGGGLLAVLSDLYKQNAESKKLRMAIRESLRREARYNCEVLRLFERTTIAPVERLAALQLDALGALFKLPVPVSVVLSDRLSGAAQEFLHGDAGDGPEGTRRDVRYRQYTEGIQSESDLIERIWLRCHVARVRTSADIGAPNLRYLLVLFRALVKTLEPDAPTRH